MANSNLIEKKVFFKKRYIFFYAIYIKMSENTNLAYYQTRDMVLSKAKDHYKNNNERD